MRSTITVHDTPVSPDSIPSQEPAGTFMAGYSVLTKSIMGAGVLSIAYACAPYGLIGGIVALIFAACLTAFSLEILVRLGVHSGLQPVTFYGVSKSILPRVPWLFDAANILNCLVCAVAFIQYSGTLLKSVIRSQVKSDSMDDGQLGRLMMCVTTAVAFPVCMLGKISQTAVVNYVALACLVVVLIMGIALVAQDPEPNFDVSKMLWPSSISEMLARFTTLLFAFACHQSVFAVMSDLGREVAAQKTTRIVLASVGTSLAIYAPLMIAPLVKYGPQVKASFLLNLPEGNSGVHAALGLAAFVVTASVGLTMIPLRFSVYSLLEVLTGTKSEPVPARKTIPKEDRNSDEATSSSEEIQTLLKPDERRTMASLQVSWFGKIAHWILELPELRRRALIGGSATLVALGMSLLPIDLHIALEVGSIVGCNTLCYVLPSYLYYKKFGFSTENKFSLLNGALLLFSLMLYPLCLGGVIYTEVTRH